MGLANKDLCAAVVNISEVATAMAEIFSTLADEIDGKATITEPQLTLEQVTPILADKSGQGFTAEIEALLQKHGAPKLSGITSTHHIG